MNDDIDKRKLLGTAEDFAKRFEDIEQYLEMMTTIGEVNVRKAEELSKARQTIAKMERKPVIQSLSSQLKASLIREIRYLFSIRKTIFAQLLQSLVFGIVRGSIFWYSPDTRGDADIMTGNIFQ